MNIEKNPLQKLQDWYLTQCNGDWEESFGIVIETLDNPGWCVRVDLNETPWENIKFKRKILQNEVDDWIQFEIVDKQFVGAGDPNKLEDIINIFIQILNDNIG